MSTSQILETLPHLTPQERAQIQAKLDELSASEWQDNGELSDADKQTLGNTLAAYAKSPEAGSSWDDVKARIQSKLQS